MSLSSCNVTKMQLQQQTNFQLLICSWLPCELSYEAVNRQWRAVWVQLANDMRRRVKFYSQPVTYNQLNVRHVVTDHWIWHARSHVESYRRPVNVSVIHWQLDNLLLSVCASAAMWRGQWGGPNEVHSPGVAMKIRNLMWKESWNIQRRLQYWKLLTPRTMCHCYDMNTTCTCWH